MYFNVPKARFTHFLVFCFELLCTEDQIKSFDHLEVSQLDREQMHIPYVSQQIQQILGNEVIAIWRGKEQE